jgi:hypothetical protein
MMAPAAHAGDKIEFSAPNAPLPVPQLERENPDAPSDHGSMMSARAPDIDGSELPPVTETIIIAPQKKESQGWGSDSTDNHDPFDPQDANSDPYSDTRQFTGATNRWDMQKGWAAAPTTLRRNEEGERSDTLRARMDSLNNPINREGDPLTEDRFSSSSTEFDSGSAWMRSIYSHTFPLDRLRTGQFVPIDSEAREVTEHAVGAAPGYASSADSQQYNYATAPGMEQYNSQIDTLHGKIPDETVTISHLSRSSGSRGGTQSYGNYSHTDDSPESRNLAPTRPAILQFPKKPGDLLR